MVERTFVYGYGPKDAKIALVGEQPARNEIRTGIPFSGAAGINLDECLRTAQIPRSSLYISNVIKDAEHDLDFYFHHVSGKYARYIPSEFGERYIEILRKELDSVEANVIVPMGNIALWALAARCGITNWRGSVIESTLLPGRKLLPTIHPAVYTNEKLFKAPSNYMFRYLIANDLKRAKRESEYPEIRQRNRQVLIEPLYGEVLEFLHECESVMQNGGTVDFDVELVPNTQDISCISFAVSPTRCMSVPLVRESGDYFDPEQEFVIWKRIRDLLEHPNYKKRGQNLVFDTHLLFRHYGIVTRNIDDTMIAQGILYPEFPNGKRLNFITAFWTDDIPYYKQDGKVWITGVGEYRKGWTYNGLDSIATADAFPKQLENLERQGNQNTYERQVRLIEPLTYMMEHGIPIDIDGMKRAQTNARTEAAAIRERLASIMGSELNIQSPPQLIEYFYGKKRLEPFLNKKGTPTVNVEAMKRIANKGFEEARLILRYRKLVKQGNTFLDVTKVDADGRMRCAYNPIGTKFGRVSSSENIFGTGCLLPETEVLTPTGWIRLDQLPENTPVIQWAPNGTLSWCVPKIVSYPFDSLMIRFESWAHRNVYTPEHRIPMKHQRGTFRVRDAYQAALTRTWHLPISGTLESGDIDFPWVRLFAVIQADGSIEGSVIRFSFRKERKIERFLFLMHVLGIKYTEQSAASGYRRFCISASHASIFISVLYSNTYTKIFGPWIFRLTQQNREDLLDEISHWDAHRRGRSFWYFSCVKENAEWVATLAHLCGYSATIRFNTNRNPGSYGEFSAIGLYTVNVKPRDYAIQETTQRSLEHYTGTVWCLQTPTSFFMCRYRERICITGNSNLQNQPHAVLTYFMADPGYVVYSLDMSQIENRIVAYVGGIRELMHAFETGLDSHRMTAARIFKIHYDDVSDEPGSCPYGNGEDSQRNWAKRANHGFNYGFGYKSFALKFEIPEADARELYRGYHDAYPGIRNGYWTHIQSCLKQNRTVTNLYDRKIVFLGKWGEKMLNEAYASLPQSTNADHINEHGISYIYYNTDPKFAPVELLTQVHDSIEIQIPLSVPLEQHARVLLDIKHSLETPLHFRTREFVVPVDLIVNYNLNKDIGRKIKWEKMDEIQLANEIRTALDEYRLCPSCEESRFFTKDVCRECEREYNDVA